jgi:two-component system response regulator
VKNATMLLVEDNPDDEALTLRAFRKSNLPIDIVVVRDGAEALEYLTASGKHADRDRENRPALILLDLNLPKIDGFRVLREMRAQEGFECTPVIIFTSSRERRDVMTGYQLGANSYVCKPVNFEEFNQAVTQIGLYWLRLNEQLPE